MIKYFKSFDDFIEGEEVALDENGRVISFKHGGNRLGRYVGKTIDNIIIIDVDDNYISQQEANEGL